jgi:uncharacterized protein (TIGR03437 family)
VANIRFSVGGLVEITARVADDCGNVIPQASVTYLITLGALNSAASASPLGDGNYRLRPDFSSSGVWTLSVGANSSGLHGLTSVQVTAAEGPVIAPAGVVNGAGFRWSVGFRPGTIVSIFGQRLAAFQEQAAGLPLPVSLGGARVSVAGRDAPLYYASSGQLNVQVPFEVPSGDTSLTVNVGGVVTGSYVVGIGVGFPGIFTLGGTQGAIQIANTTEFAAPAGSVPGASARPVRRGEFITIYCSGLGLTQPAVATGVAAPATPLASVAGPVRVYFGMGLDGSGTVIQSAEASFAGLVPGLVSLYQVNVRVPDDAIVGPAVELAIAHGGAQSRCVTLAIQ